MRGRKREVHQLEQGRRLAKAGPACGDSHTACNAGNTASTVITKCRTRYND